MQSMTRNYASSTALMLLYAAVDLEIRRAGDKHGAINSAHEGYAVILEELDEFWDEVKKKRELRSRDAMLVELLQVAATALRTAHDLELAEHLDGATAGHMHLRLKGQAMHLMLAAPDMLAALEAADTFLTGFDDQQAIDEGFISAGLVDQVRAAITKAKGEEGPL